MNIVSAATVAVPVASHQVNLATSGGNVALTHPRVAPVIRVADDDLALWCAGSEMLTTITVRVHTDRPTDPTGGAATGPDAVEEAAWSVTRPGHLLAHTLDLGVTPLPGIHLGAGSWLVRVTVRNRAAAERLDDELADEDEAAFGPDAKADPDLVRHGRSGLEPGPEVWLIDLWPASGQHIHTVR